MENGKIAKTEPKDMSFLDHLSELRKYIMICLYSIAIGSVAGFFLFNKIVPLLISKYDQNLFVSSPAEALILQLNFAFGFGVFISVPVLLACIVLYILPALGNREKTVLFAGVGAALVLFVGGMLYSYFIMLPVALKFLLNPVFFPAQIKSLLNYTQSLKFIMGVVLAFSLTFEFPVLLYVLLHFNLLTVKQLTDNFRYIIIIIFILAAIITPSPDVITQSMLAIPCLVLFILTIIVAKLTGVGKGRVK